MKEIIIEVEGMRCGMCESHVCDAIRRASDKVKKVTASHLKNFADVIAEDDASSDVFSKSKTRKTRVFAFLPSEACVCGRFFVRCSA